MFFDCGNVIVRKPKLINVPKVLHFVTFRLPFLSMPYFVSTYFLRCDGRFNAWYFVFILNNHRLVIQIYINYAVICKKYHAAFPPNLEIAPISESNLPVVLESLTACSTAFVAPTFFEVLFSISSKRFVIFINSSNCFF